jgi:cell division protein FtsB
MSLVREIHRRGRHVLGPTLGALLVGYFLLHAFQGDRGVVQWMHLRQQVAQAETTLARTGAARRELETHVRLLRADNLDPDLLDERARLMAGLARADELVVLYPRARFER